MRLIKRQQERTGMEGCPGHSEEKEEERVGLHKGQHRVGEFIYISREQSWGGGGLGPSIVYRKTCYFHSVGGKVVSGEGWWSVGGVVVGWEDEEWKAGGVWGCDGGGV